MNNDNENASLKSYEEMGWTKTILKCYQERGLTVKEFLNLCEVILKKI